MVFGGRFLNGDFLCVGFRIFLDDDGVGAVGNGRAGEDAYRLVAADGTLVTSASRRLADSFQGHRNIFNVA